MQETWLVDYPFPIAAESLSDFLITQSKDLGIFLSYYFKKEGAVAENVTLKSLPSLTSDTSGELTLVFDLVYFNACLAIHEKEKSEMEIKFEWDANNHRLKLIGAYWPERGMDEI